MRIYILFGLFWGMIGCISDDIPLPVIYGNVQKIEFNGQQKCVINTRTRTIELTLSDTVDIKRVYLNTLEITADPAREQSVDIVPATSLKVDSFVDLSKPFRFLINTYQEYEWTITADQPVERYFKVAHQVGDAVINLAEKMVKITVEKGQSLSNIQVEDVKLGSSIATYDPDPLTLTNFQKQQVIYVTCFGRIERWLITAFIDSGETAGTDITGEVNAWAKLAYLNGNIPSGKTGTPYFEIKEARATTWTKVTAVVSGKTFTAKATGLKPQTTYSVRGVVGEEQGTEVSFTTEAAEQVPYSNFDLWYKNGKAWYTGVEGISTWDSGNGGGASFGFNPTSEETSDVIKGSAAKLASCYAAVKFAAGSLYTGKFAGLDGFNAKLDFGIPYTCRPTRLTGYYKYNSGTVDKVPDNGKFDFIKNKTDSCHIYVALCDWTEAFHANSKTETFVDYSADNSSIIAYGELKNDRKMSAYEKFTIDIQYRDLTRKPTYIVIVATSSKYGDYFAGSTTSVLLLDEFELSFD